MWISDIIYGYRTVDFSLSLPPCPPPCQPVNVFLSVSRAFLSVCIVFCAVTTKCHNDNLSRKCSIQRSRGLNKSTKYTTDTHTQMRTQRHQPVFSADVLLFPADTLKKGEKKRTEMLPSAGCRPSQSHRWLSDWFSNCDGNASLGLI